MRLFHYRMSRLSSPPHRGKTPLLGDAMAGAE
jgi:hypothetical protein